MLSIKEEGLLINIIKHCEKIKCKCANVTFEKFIENEDLLEIICFNIIQIGELVKNFDENFTKKYNAVPWKQIARMRDKVAHGYGTVDKNKVYYTATKDITILQDYCSYILATA